MSFMDYKYNGWSIRHRWESLIGVHVGPIGWIVRGAIIAFALRTMADPSESIYIHPLGWVGIIAFIYFYL